MIILKTKDGVLDAADEPGFQQLQTRLAAGPVKLLIHLHGGLVDEAHGVQIATALGGAPPQGFGLGQDWEQLFVVWRTGFVETLKDEWPKLFDNDRLYKTLLKRLLDFAASKLGLPGADGRSAFTAMGLSPTEIARRLDERPQHDPFLDVDLTLEANTPGGRGPLVATDSDGAIAQDFTLRLRQDTEFNAIADDIAAALTVDPATGRALSIRGDPVPGAIAFDHLSDNIKAGLAGTVPPEAEGRALFTGVQVATFLLKHAGLIAIRVIRRFRGKRDHGFYATVVEELVRECYGDLIGAAVWGLMKADAADHFHAAGLGARLIQVLAQHPPERIVVSGHSAGSIWASELLIAMAGTPGAPKVRLAFMAPAVRSDHFAEALDKAGGLVEGLRMFTMRDDLERKDPVLGANLAFIYPSSLLYLISGCLEDRNADAFPDAPVLGMQRFFTQNPAWLTDPDEIAAVGTVMAFLAQPTSGVVWSQVSGGPGLSSQANSHGGFDQDPDTIASVAVFARSP